MLVSRDGNRTCVRSLEDASAKPSPPNKQSRFRGRSNHLDLALRQSKCADLRKLFCRIGTFATTAAAANRVFVRVRSGDRARRSEPPSSVVVRCRKPGFRLTRFPSQPIDRSHDGQVGGIARRGEWHSENKKGNSMPPECEPAKADRPHEAAGKRTSVWSRPQD